MKKGYRNYFNVTALKKYICNSVLDYLAEYLQVYVDLVD